MWAVCLPWAISLHSRLSFSTFLLSKRPVIKNASKLAWRVCDTHCWSVVLGWESWQTQTSFCSTVLWIFRMLLHRSAASEWSHSPPVILYHQCPILRMHARKQFMATCVMADLYGEDQKPDPRSSLTSLFSLSSAPPEPTLSMHMPPVQVSVGEKYVGGSLIRREGFTLTHA